MDSSASSAHNAHYVRVIGNDWERVRPPGITARQVSTGTTSRASPPPEGGRRYCRRRAAGNSRRLIREARPRPRPAPRSRAFPARTIARPPGAVRQDVDCRGPRRDGAGPGARSHAQAGRKAVGWEGYRMPFTGARCFVPCLGRFPHRPGASGRGLTWGMASAPAVVRQHSHGGPGTNAPHTSPGIVGHRPKAGSLTVLRMAGAPWRVSQELTTTIIAIVSIGTDEHDPETNGREHS